MKLKFTIWTDPIFFMFSLTYDKMLDHKTGTETWLHHYEIANVDPDLVWLHISLEKKAKKNKIIIINWDPINKVCVYGPIFLGMTLTFGQNIQG